MSSWLYARGCARLAGGKLELRWSPRQIAGWLALAYPDDPQMQVSRETIYLSLFVQARGALRRELTRCLRTGRARRRPRGLTTRNGQGKICGMVNISPRPAEAGDRAVPGHWEGDLLSGTRSSTIATLAERQSRFVMLVGLPGSHTAGVAADALAGAITSLPGQLRRSLTWDQGKEMAEHARFSVATGVPVYFCGPHSPWQRGSNQNTNGLLRLYFPPSTGFRALTQRDLGTVAAELNGRPTRCISMRLPTTPRTRTFAACRASWLIGMLSIAATGFAGRSCRTRRCFRPRPLSALGRAVRGPAAGA